MDKLRKRILLIVSLLGCLLLAGCGGKEMTASADASEFKQETETDTLTETSVPDTPESEEKEASETGNGQESSEPVDNYYVHRFDSFDDLLLAYKEAQERHYTKDQVELIFGYGEPLVNYGWPDELSPYDVGYVYYDVDSDGTDELIITVGNEIVEIYSRFGDKVQRFYAAPYGEEVTLYPGGILKQVAPDDSEFPGTSWFTYDAGLAGYYEDFEETPDGYYTFCHFEIDDADREEIEARLREDPDADMPVWMHEWSDELTKSEYEKLLPKSSPIEFPAIEKLFEVALPEGYEPRYEANEGYEDEVIPEYLIYVKSPDGYANLRTGPGTEYDVICQIPTGDSMEVYRVSTTDENGKKWLKVAYWHPNGTSQSDGSDDVGTWETGWIAESQVE